MKYTRNIMNRIGRTVVSHKMLAGNDKILVALSGGKDSLILLEALAECRKNLPFIFELMAAHIHIENVGYLADIKFIESFCSSLSIPFIYKNTSLETSKNLRKGICYLCSWQRRKELFNISKEFSCNKIALGHHMDDAVETLLLNMVYHGSVSSIPYSLRMFDGKVQLIRPLLELTDRELERYANLMNYTQPINSCPHGNSKRKEMSRIIDQLCLVHKTARKNIFRSMGNIYPGYLPNRLK